MQDKHFLQTWGSHVWKLAKACLYRENIYSVLENIHITQLLLSLFIGSKGGAILIVTVIHVCWIKINTWLGCTLCITLFLYISILTLVSKALRLPAFCLDFLLCINILPIECIVLKLPTFCLKCSFTLAVSLPFVCTITWYWQPAYCFIIYL